MYPSFNLNMKQQPLKTTTLRLDRSTIHRLNEASSLSQMTRADFIRTCLDDTLKIWEEGGKEKLLTDLLNATGSRRRKNEEDITASRRKS